MNKSITSVRDVFVMKGNAPSERYFLFVSVFAARKQLIMKYIIASNFKTINV
jgi:hypothetical protein